MLQHSTDMYSFSYISWLKLAAEYGGCSQWVFTLSLIVSVNLVLQSKGSVFDNGRNEFVLFCR